MIRQSLSKKLLIRILLASSVVTLVITSVQLLYDYNNGKKNIQSTVELVLDNNLSTLKNSAWNFDLTTIRLIFESMVRSPDVLYVRYPDQKIEVGALDQIPQLKVVERLDFVDPAGVERNLGTVEVGVTYTNLYYELFNKILVILLTQAIKTLIVSLFILYVIEKMIIQPLKEMGGYIRKVDFRSEVPDLEIEASHKDDEIGLISTHVNESKRLAFERHRFERERLESLAKVVAGVAHEIKNPVHLISNVGVFFKEGRTRKDVDSGLRILDNNCQRIRDILNSMNMLQRGFALKLETVNLKQFLEEQVAAVRKEEDFLNIEVNSFLEEVGEVTASQGELIYSIKELLQNAADSIHQKFGQGVLGGEIRIILESGMMGPLLTIRDNGIGMSPEVLKSAIDPFFTTKNSRTRRGLGLSVTFNIVNVHLGRLTLRSKEGNFAEVKIEFSHSSKEGFHAA